MSNTFEILARGRCNFGGGKWYEGHVRKNPRKLYTDEYKKTHFEAVKAGVRND